MVKIAYLDLASGASEKRILGAILNLGVGRDKFKKRLNKLDLSRFGIDSNKSLRILNKERGIEVEFQIKLNNRFRNNKMNYLELKDIIVNLDLENKVKEMLVSVIETLFGVKERVKFRKAIKSIIFTFSILIGLELLEIDKVYAATIHIGNCSQPSVLEMLKGHQISVTAPQKVLTTELGAAIIINLVDEFGQKSKMLLKEIGYGLGNKQKGEQLKSKVMLGEIEEIVDYDQDEIIVIETNIDDMNPEFYDHIVVKLLSSGALDAYMTPINMKKNRPGQKLTVLLKEKNLSQILEIIFAETTTLGVRFNRKKRYKLQRQIETVRVESKKVKIKLGYNKDNRILNIAPEYESCKQAALETDLTLAEVYRRALINFENQENIHKID